LDTSIKNLYANLVFQFKNHHAQGRLRYITMFGRFGKMAESIYRKNVFQLLYIHLLLLIIDFIYAKIEIISLTSAI